jgi:hypothetical protein
MERPTLELISALLLDYDLGVLGNLAVDEAHGKTSILSPHEGAAEGAGLEKYQYSAFYGSIGKARPTSRNDGSVCERSLGNPPGYDTAISSVSSFFGGGRDIRR